eukprot:PhM_4_TR11542/c0_g1_i1/m.88858
MRTSSLKRDAAAPSTARTSTTTCVSVASKRSAPSSALTKPVSAQNTTTTAATKRTISAPRRTTNNGSSVPTTARTPVAASTAPGTARYARSRSLPNHAGANTTAPATAPKSHAQQQPRRSIVLPPESEIECELESIHRQVSKLVMRASTLAPNTPDNAMRHSLDVGWRTLLEQGFKREQLLEKRLLRMKSELTGSKEVGKGHMFSVNYKNHDEEVHRKLEKQLCEKDVAIAESQREVSELKLLADGLRKENARLMGVIHSAGLAVEPASSTMPVAKKNNNSNNNETNGNNCISGETAPTTVCLHSPTSVAHHVSPPNR